MSNAYTDTSALAGLVKAAYDRYVEFALRSQPLFRNLADKRPVQQAMPGSSVVFSLYNDLAAATSTLTETVDPDAVALSNVSTVTVTLNEYGNTVLNTRKLGEFAFSDVDPAVANIVAYNMADSIDRIVVSTLIGGTNVIYGGSATATSGLTAADVIAGEDIRKAVAKLRAANAVPREGMLYAAYMHPEVAHDLRSESGSLSFEDIRKYTDPNVGNILNATTGVYGGAYVVETPRAYVGTDGSGSAKVYRTIIAGQQALAEATAVEPGVVIGPVVDKLMRFRPVGWYSLQGFSVYRQASLYRIETGSSIAA
jgi:N4-gp56 family major capsid protein